MIKQIHNKIADPMNTNSTRCLDCGEVYELTAGASNCRCRTCDQRYLKNEAAGRVDGWRRWVYGSKVNPQHVQF